MSTTRRGVLLGAGLAGLSGTLAGCSTKAVPYEANEAGQLPGTTPAGSSAAMAGGAMGSASPGGAPTSGGSPGGANMQGSMNPGTGSTQGDNGSRGAKIKGTVLGSASEIPIGGGKIFTAAQVVVTQPARGQYRAFSAVCTHVGCILNKIASGTIDCPCHGSEFRITDGSLVTGPANGPLPRKKIKIVRGKVVLL